MSAEKSIIKSERERKAVEKHIEKMQRTRECPNETQKRIELQEPKEEKPVQKTKLQIKLELQLEKQEKLLREQELRDEAFKERTERKHEEHLETMQRHEEARQRWELRRQQIMEEEKQQVEQKRKKIIQKSEQGLKRRSENLDAIKLSIQLGREQKAQRIREHVRRIKSQMVTLYEQYIQKMIEHHERIYAEEELQLQKQKEQKLAGAKNKKMKCKCESCKLERRLKCEDEEHAACDIQSADAKNPKRHNLYFTKNIRFSTNALNTINTNKMRWRLHMRRQAWSKSIAKCEHVDEEPASDLLRVHGLICQLYQSTRMTLELFDDIKNCGSTELMQKVVNCLQENTSSWDHVAQNDHFVSGLNEGILTAPPFSRKFPNQKLSNISVANETPLVESEANSSVAINASALATSLEAAGQLTATNVVAEDEEITVVKKAAALIPHEKAEKEVTENCAVITVPENNLTATDDGRLLKAEEVATEAFKETTDLTANKTSAEEIIEEDAAITGSASADNDV